MSGAILFNFMHPQGRGAAQPHLAWLYYQVPRINHTLYSHIPAPILLSKKTPKIRDEWKKRETDYDKLLLEEQTN